MLDDEPNHTVDVAVLDYIFLPRERYEQLIALERQSTPTSISTIQMCP
jgi:hypothetical protein